ncbi:MAG: GAF domain-containing protein [Desulfobulbaceae bacterium]|uniref:histidine kinase n=1 Tax=Candidatus Desulfatifera sulfidica TaxID=2841691 RepID=A0A8J6NCN3_9BACT|nr:GAF domain-containing protein [Candidatus Desulfatifera sulfidica]
MVLDHQQVMDVVVRELPELLDIDAATIRLLDGSTNNFVLGAAHGLSLEYLSRSMIDTEETMEMIRSGQPVARSGIGQGQELSERDLAAREGIRSVLTLPILFQDALIGILRLLTRSERVFSEEEVSFSMALAEQVGIAISNGRMFKDMESQVDFMREVQEISALVNSTLDLDLTLNSMVEKLPSCMGAKGCTIRLLKSQKNHLELVAAHGLSQGYLDRGRIEGEKNISRALRGEMVSVYDVAHDDRIDFGAEMAAEGICSLLSVPLKVGGEVIGVIRVLMDVHHSFTSTEIKFAETVAEIGGTAIQNARTYRKITLLFNQLEESERFVANILNCIRPQLLVVDRDMRLVLANHALLEAVGRSEAEVLGMNYHELWNHDDCQVDQCPVNRVLSDGEPSTYTHQIMKEDGVHWIERTASPMHDREGLVEYVIEIIRDVTAKRRFEEEQLERVKLQGVVELAGTVAHEINTPLFAALGTAQLLEDDIEGSDARNEVATIVRNLRTIGDLTAKMTRMTGFESRDYVGDTKIVDLK